MGTGLEHQATIRAFIAIPLSDELRTWLGVVLTELSERYSEIRWVRPENVHLTLRFLGDIAEGRVRDVLEVMDDVFMQLESPLSIGLGDPGSFGRRTTPRTLWISLQTGPQLERLKKVQADLETALVERGFEGEPRQWRPHLTLGRNPRGRRAIDWESVVDHTVEEGSRKRPPILDVTECVMFSSELTPRGPIYQPLGSRRIGCKHR